jgi:hypothetical protein
MIMMMGTAHGAELHAVPIDTGVLIGAGDVACADAIGIQGSVWLGVLTGPVRFNSC